MGPLKKHLGENVLGRRSHPTSGAAITRSQSQGSMCRHYLHAKTLPKRQAAAQRHCAHPFVTLRTGRHDDEPLASTSYDDQSPFMKLKHPLAACGESDRDPVEPCATASWMSCNATI